MNRTTKLVIGGLTVAVIVLAFQIHGMHDQLHALSNHLDEVDKHVKDHDNAINGILHKMNDLWQQVWDWMHKGLKNLWPW